MSIGVFGGTVNDGTVDDVVAEARQAEADGFDSYWAPQIFGNDALTALAVVAREVPRIELGTSVVPTYPRHPMMLAQQALTVNAASGGRLCLGIGLSHQIVIESMMGMSFDKPVRHLREYLGVLGPLSRGEPVALRRRGLPRPRRGRRRRRRRRSRSSSPPSGRRCCKATAELADGTLTWCTGPQTLAEPHRPDDQRRRRRRRPTGAAGDRRPAGLRHRRRRRRPRAGRQGVRRVRPAAELPGDARPRGRRRARPTSPSSARRPRSAERVAALADIGVTDFAAVEFGGNPDEVAATRGRAGGYARR